VTPPVDLARLVRRLELPPGFVAPTHLRDDDVSADAITRDHLEEDVRGINASLDLIRRTRGGGWPDGPVTPEGNYVDLVWHECEFRDGKSFTFVLRDGAGEYIGCAYLYPVGVRRPLTQELLAHDVDVSWWVTPDAYDRGLYAAAHEALRRWSVEDFPFAAPFFSNVELPEAK
jgi:RimJ/RimL family protein N-acetyltransferase